MTGITFEDMKEMLANEVMDKNMLAKRCFQLEQEVIRLKKSIEAKDKEMEALKAQITAK